MSILKALEKNKSKNEEPSKDSQDKSKDSSKRTKVVQFGQNGQNSRSLPEIFKNKNFKIGTPSSVFNEQSASLVGTALPELETEESAGATLNTIGLTRPAVSHLPEFARWEVEAERVEPRLVAITHPHSSYCEEYRSLRTHILHKSQRQNLQSIVIASVNPSEGKTVTAINLSWLLAQTDGVNALIIDSDLRMPSLADYLGIETDKGLSGILEGSSSLKDSIVRLEPAGLHLLPGGEARHDVAELISGPKFREILREAREMFDYVIIDAPPLGVFTDAAVLINHADGAMLIIRSGRTKYRDVDRIMDTLPKDRMLGVVLNQSEDVMTESQYDYGYYKNHRLGY